VEYHQQQIRAVPFCQIRCNLGQELFHQAVQVRQAHGLHFVHAGLNDFPLAAGPVKVGTDGIAVTGIGKRLLAVEMIGAVFRLRQLVRLRCIRKIKRLHIHIVDVIVHDLDLILGQVQINAVDAVHEFLDEDEVDHHRAVHVNAVVLLDRLIHQIRAADGISRIQAVAAVAGNRHIAVPQQRGHQNVLAGLINAAQHHGVAAAGEIVIAGIHADDHDVHQIRGKSGTVLLGFQIGFQLLLKRRFLFLRRLRAAVLFLSEKTAQTARQRLQHAVQLMVTEIDASRDHCDRGDYDPNPAALADSVAGLLRCFLL